MANMVYNGYLSKVYTAVTVRGNPLLSLRASDLAEQVISAPSWEGNAYQLIPTATGMVRKIEPKNLGTIELYILKGGEGSPADLWYKSYLYNPSLGAVSIHPDISNGVAYDFDEAGIQHCSAPFDGTEPYITARLHVGMYVSQAYALGGIIGNVI